MRPLYESAVTRAAEEALARAVADAWRAQAVKIGATVYPVDYALVRDGRVAALAEFKCRRYPLAKLDRMGGFMLSLHKWIAIVQHAEAGGVPVFLVIEDGDGAVWWHRPRGAEHDGVVMGGRKDRGDAQDIEPVILLRASRFTSLPCRPCLRAA